MQTLIETINHHRKALALPDQGTLTVELRAPWRFSNTGRCLYVVRLAGSHQALLALQDGVSLSGAPCPQNPYEPARFATEVESLLVPNRGVLEWGRRSLYWAHWINAPTLDSRLRVARRNANGGSALMQTARLIGDLQGKTVMAERGYFTALLNHVTGLLPRESLPRLVFDYEELSAVYPLPCAWSHGDLWPEDIFITDAGVTIVDWEWALPCAPVGCDLVDLYVTTVIHALGLKTDEAWRSLSGQSPGRLQPLRDELDRHWATHNLDSTQRTAVIIYGLMRSALRILCQDGRMGVSLADQLFRIAAGHIGDRQGESSPLSPCSAVRNLKITGNSAVEEADSECCRDGDETSKKDPNEQSESTKAVLLAQIARLPGDVDTLIALARMAQAENKPQDALAFLQDVLILNPCHQEALFLKEQIEQRQRTED